MPKEVEFVLFVVCASAVFLLFLTWFLYAPIKRFFYKYHTVRSYYHKVYRVALERDFFLVNKFANRTADLEEFHIDHILFGNKYFYCIRDRYYDGALAAKEEDESWIFFHKKKTEYIKNPMMVNKLRLQRLSLMSGIEEKFFISIVLINDDCLLTPLKGTSDDSFLVSLRDFPKLIDQLEARDVDPLDERSVAVAARDFAALNESDG
ncbi:MAG: hypothetical protein IJS37_01405 [Bacilli bacterium]|nr:hypothetical protein [Bacilli bacterium]